MTDTTDIYQLPLRMWVPGHGDVDVRTRAVARAISEYDEALMLARHEMTGEWVVFHRKGPDGGKPYPIFGLGHGELPHPDDVIARLQKAVRKPPPMSTATQRPPSRQGSSKRPASSGARRSWTCW